MTNIQQISLEVQHSGVNSLSLNEFDMWYGDKSMTAHSIEEVMDTKFFDGKSLEDILNDITDLEY